RHRRSHDLYGLRELEQQLNAQERREPARDQGQPAIGADVSRGIHAPLRALPRASAVEFGAWRTGQNGQKEAIEKRGQSRRRRLYPQAKPGRVGEGRLYPGYGGLQGAHPARRRVSLTADRRRIRRGGSEAASAQRLGCMDQYFASRLKSSAVATGLVAHHGSAKGAALSVSVGQRLKE